MVDLAKQLNNNAEMIQLAQIFCQQPRNTVSAIYLTRPRVFFLTAIFSHPRKASSTANKHPRTRSCRVCSSVNSLELTPRSLLAELQLGVQARFPSGNLPP